MQFDSRLEKTSETLRDVAMLIGSLESERVLAAIINKRMTHEDIVDYTLRLKEKRARQCREIERLKRFSGTFNKEYATDHNTCFSTTRRLFGIIRSNMSETMKVFKKFCPKVMERGPMIDGVEIRPSVIDRTMLNPDVPYTIPLFGTEHCDSCVAEFITELNSFFVDTENAIMMCDDVIEEEKRIREDNMRCMKLYDKCCEEVLKKSYEFIEYFGEDGFAREDDMSAEMEKTPMREDFASEHFHRHNRNEFQIHVLHKAFNDGRTDDLSDIETFLWLKDHEMARRVRIVVEHFDEIKPKGRQVGNTGQYRLSGQYVAVLMKWAGIKDSMKEKHFVEKYFNNQYHGIYRAVAYSTVNTAKNKLLYDEYEEKKILGEIEYIAEKYG